MGDSWVAEVVDCCDGGWLVYLFPSPATATVAALRVAGRDGSIHGVDGGGVLAADLVDEVCDFVGEVLLGLVLFVGVHLLGPSVLGGLQGWSLVSVSRIPPLKGGDTVGYTRFINDNFSGYTRDTLGIHSKFLCFTGFFRDTLGIHLNFGCIPHLGIHPPLLVVRNLSDLSAMSSVLGLLSF